MREYQGLDISSWQEGMNVSEWANALGLDFIILKCGGDEGGRYRDRTFDGFYRQAKALGLHVGAYYYSTACDTTTAYYDAEHCLGLLDGYDLDMPVYFDFEDARQFSLSARELTDVVKAFCDRVNAGGRKAGLYTGGSAWLNNVYNGELLNYADWIAWWADFGNIENVRARCGDIGMWQVGGIALNGHIAYGDVAGHEDYDVCCIKYWEQINGGGSSEPEEEPSNLLCYSDLAAEVMWHKITHEQHGYSQPNRSTNYDDKEHITLSDGTGADIAAWDDDCSSAVRDCYLSIGVDVSYYTYTGNEAGGLLDSGNFVRISPYDAQNGDIVLRDGHTEMVLVRNNTRYQGGFRHGDWGIDGVTGDQDGTESTYSMYDPDAWEEAFRCVKERSGSRPQGSSNNTSTGAASNNTYGGSLDVDGWAGFNTVLDMQTALGTYQDGYISGQTYGGDVYRQRVSAVEHGSGGSTMVRALQRLIGAGVDGYWGCETSTRLQQYLESRGYDVGGVDGYFGPNSVMALQRCLNDGNFGR